MCTNFKGEPKLRFSLMISFGSFFLSVEFTSLYMEAQSLFFVLHYSENIGERVESINNKGYRENKRQNSTRTG